MNFPGVVGAEMANLVEIRRLVTLKISVCRMAELNKSVTPRTPVRIDRNGTVCDYLIRWRRTLVHKRPARGLLSEIGHPFLFSNAQHELWASRHSKSKRDLPHVIAAALSRPTLSSREKLLIWLNDLGGFWTIPCWTSSTSVPYLVVGVPMCMPSLYIFLS